MNERCALGLLHADAAQIVLWRHRCRRGGLLHGSRHLPGPDCNHAIEVGMQQTQAARARSEQRRTDTGGEGFAAGGGVAMAAAHALMGGASPVLAVRMASMRLCSSVCEMRAASISRRCRSAATSSSLRPAPTCAGADGTAAAADHPAGAAPAACPAVAAAVAAGAGRAAVGVLGWAGTLAGCAAGRCGGGNACATGDCGCAGAGCVCAAYASRALSFTTCIRRITCP